MARFAVLRVSAVVLLFAVAAPCAKSQQDEPKPKVSSDPLTAEQLTVYRTVLHDWMDDGKSIVHLQALTEVFPTSGANDSSDCLKGLDMEPAKSEVHRFRPADLPQFGSSRIRLVDGDAQEKEVEQNDPGKAIQNGTSVDDAVSNGFAHGKTWLSEIRFDKTHTHAVVFYGFVCGGLCGNGGTVILEKTAKGWKRKSQCSVWMS
jgi:hypothetical protein